MGCKLVNFAFEWQIRGANPRLCSVLRLKEGVHWCHLHSLYVSFNVLVYCLRRRLLWFCFVVILALPWICICLHHWGRSSDIHFFIIRVHSPLIHRHHFMYFLKMFLGFSDVMSKKSGFSYLCSTSIIYVPLITVYYDVI